MALSRFDKTRIVLITLCIIIIIVAFFIQIYGQSSISTACSYLDPITIDILAFIAALFLIIEGSFAIYNHKNLGLKRQIYRIIRIGIGFAILTLHAMQFLHK